MTTARIIVLAGSTCAALFAFWAGYLLFQVSPGRRLHFHDTSDLWFSFGIPVPLAAFVGTFLLTGRREWTRKLGARGRLLVFALSTTALGCLIYVPLQVVWIVILHLSLPSNDAWGGPLAGVALIFSAYLDLVAIAFGFLPAMVFQLMVLYLARSAVPADDLLTPDEFHSQP